MQKKYTKMYKNFNNINIKKFIKAKIARLNTKRKIPIIILWNMK